MKLVSSFSYSSSFATRHQGLHLHGRHHRLRLPVGRLLQGRLEEGPSRTEYEFFGRDGFDGATTNYNANCSATRFALQGASNLVTTGCSGHVVFAFTAHAGVKRDDSGKEISVARQKNTVLELTSTMTERLKLFKRTVEAASVSK